mmetsp:Transcript_622/g.1004  ORF Transcript_622/g.1004 Transcript_622/m.1004 type:complete len:244 (+) Transcript_622:16-747(+)
MRLNLSRTKKLLIVTLAALTAAVLVVHISFINRLTEENNDSEKLKMSLAATGQNEWAEDQRSKTMEKKCSAAVDKLVDCGINFLAIDFDQTMIDVHTGGRWKGTALELTEHMRPVFLHLVPAATNRNIRIAVCTFSGQTKHIRDVMEYVFPNIAELIVIRGNDETWKYHGNGFKRGKQEHMASAVEELLTEQALGVTEVTKATTLLIDDDPKNIRISLNDRTRAIWFNPKRPNDLLDNILMLK